MKKAFFMILPILLLFSLTSALVGNPAPTMQQAVNMISSISVDVEGIVSAVSSKFDDALISFEMPNEDANIFESALAGLKNFFIGIINGFIEIFSVIFSILAIVGELFKVLLSYFDVVVYLLFGDSFMAGGFNAPVLGT